ncbi:hypothetical protein GQ457_09G008720 [Hibiscus cannabinus]
MRQRQALAISFYSIWYTKNQVLHEGLAPLVSSSLSFVEAFLSEHDLINSQASHRPLRLHDNWIAPALSIIKLNFDASYDASAGKSVSGVLCRDNDGFILAACSNSHSHVAVPFQAEALACLVAVTFAKDLDFTRVIAIDVSLVIPVVADIKEVAKVFQDVKFNFVHRETNVVAHTLAQERKLYNGPMYWKRKLPLDRLSLQRRIMYSESSLVFVKQILNAQGVQCSVLVADLPRKEWLAQTFVSLSMRQRQALAISFYSIWYTKNQVLHEGLAPSVSSSLSFVEAFLSEHDLINSQASHRPLRLHDNWIEALTCLMAVTFAKDLVFTRVIVEGDSLTIIKKCASKAIDVSLVSPVVGTGRLDCCRKGSDYVNRTNVPQPQCPHMGYKLPIPSSAIKGAAYILMKTGISFLFYEVVDFAVNEFFY